MIARSSAIRQSDAAAAPRDAVALRAFFRLAGLWGLTMEQARVLLGRPARATLYNWKARFGGMDVSEAKRLKQLEDENAKLKKLLAEQMLDAAAMRELLSKKW